MKPLRMALAPLLLLALLSEGAAQDPNILLPVDSVETLLTRGEFEVMAQQGSRFEGDRTARTALSFTDGTMMVSKWAPAAPGGETFNNVPRYEIAAYEIQKLFLEDAELVVPPTVARAFPLAWYRELDPDVEATFRDTRSVVVVLQYWLFNVTNDEIWDRDRFDADTAYARNFANFNILTYLIRHSDENQGNYLMSRNEDNPRVFSVDNGVAFASQHSDRGYRWRRIRVDRLPAATIDRLRRIAPDDLVRRLETVAEFRVEPDGLLTRVYPGPALDPHEGVRREGDRIQFGLTRTEIDGIRDRLERLLNNVDRGRIELFDS